MIDRQALLKDLQGVLRTLEADLLERSESAEVPEVPAALKEEYNKAKEAQRTAQNYEDWRSDYVTQIAAAWVLSCVFARFLEDNQLVDPPKLAGPGGRLDRARDEHTMFFQDRERATQTDREYLLHVFGELAKLPGAKEVFGEHNPVWELPNWLSGDAAGELLRFFRRIDADTGVLVHDFADPDWDTRFLGDLYQDLSEAARKKYALLQTPEFVEEFILDRTLEPALDEFGLVVSGQSSVISRQSDNETDNRQLTTDNFFKMIDPACGSGHFLLGVFPRILERWQREEPAAGVRDLVGRTLHSIHGVDLNAFAVAIARFRLLMAALRACGITRLADAPAFELNLACGDSLYHGREQQMMLEGVETDESHYFRSEDAPSLRRMLREGMYHCVVANPPYIISNDQAANSVYRRLYTACYRQYSLAVPFMQRILALAVSSGYTGQITTNSFMTAAFGIRLIEDVLAKADIQLVLDTSKAHIPGHGTGTVILAIRARAPLSPTVRAVLGKRGEPVIPAIPDQGRVWTSIEELIDHPDSESEYISVTDTPRKVFAVHPWVLSGGGAAELQRHLKSQSSRDVSHLVAGAGFLQDTHADEAFVFTFPFARRKAVVEWFRPHGRGENVRNWLITSDDAILFPYTKDLHPWPSLPERGQWSWFWSLRTYLWGRTDFSGSSYRHAGRQWYEFHQMPRHRVAAEGPLVFAATATHNHFALSRVQTVFNRSAPIVVVSEAICEHEKWRLLASMNCSTAGFLLRQVSQPKAGGGIGRGLTPLAYERRRQFQNRNILEMPLPNELPDYRIDEILLSVNALIDVEANQHIRSWSQSGSASLFTHRDEGNRQWYDALSKLIYLQEEVDWECYRLYRLTEEDLTYGLESIPVRLGERAFEIVMARKMAAGELQTTWFERHGSTPVTELPDHWPDDYKRLVERRIALIESDRNIGLIEQPEYKRRWNTEPWDSQVERALRNWLLDRLEGYLDLDGRMTEEGTPTTKLDIAFTTIARLADVARHDAQFMEAGEVYRNDPAFDVQRLVEELVADESVPLLPVLRYKPPGLRKRVEWEKTWELQRAEDSLSDQIEVVSRQLSVVSKKLKEEEVSENEGLKTDNRQLTTLLEKLKTEHCQLTTSIPVPPKYTSSDFISSGGARYWSLRGKLDVPKERWASFPYCEGEDGTPVIAWAGYDHLQLARAISAYYVDVQERLGGRDDPRLVPLLACLVELLPWLKQWHNEIDPEFGMAMGDYFEGFINEEARQMGKTVDEIKNWEPPKKAGRRRKKAK